MPKVPTPPSTNKAPQKITEPAVYDRCYFEAKKSLTVFLFRVLTLELCLAPKKVLNKSEEMGGSSKTPPFILR